MKTRINRLFALSSISMLMLVACKKDGAIVTTTGGTAGALTVSASTLVLSKNNLTDTTKVINFSFTQPSFGFSSAITNTLQIDAPGDNWVSPKSVTLPVRVLKTGYSTADFNLLLLKLNLPTGVASSIMVRVMSTVSVGMNPIYTNAATINATPFALTSFLYVPGAYQGWNPATADSLLSATSNGIYTGIINFTVGNLEFKINPAKNWNDSYGYDANGNVKENASNGSNFKSPAAGLYWVTLNLNTSTITYVAVTKYYSLIGDATVNGWSGDTDMKYNNGTTSWTVVAPLTASGAFKVRLNHDWGTSYGYLANPDGMTLTSANGGNIKVAADGSYMVTFQPIFDATGNTTATATYSVVKQ